MILIVGTFNLLASEMPLATDLTKTVVAATLGEPGCQRYHFSVDVADPNRMLLVECWESADALATHLRQPHTREFLSRFRQLRVQHRRVQEYRVSGTTEFDPRQYADPMPIEPTWFDGSCSNAV
ncbi:putative quinol monooxygenase [Bradyrhizobium sp. USDA 4502]